MWFEKLGIYGMNEIEDVIITGIAIGDPVLLIGTHGTAKTTLCRKLAEVLGLKFHAYDASKALFEDIIGFPNPETISKGKIDYVPTALSIWDKEFVLIDEISRARAESQNKWLEVIRSRKVMGLPIKNLKIIFAAMNPPSYFGSYPLDEALASRFSLIVNIPPIIEMADDDVKKIINNITEDDGKGLSNRIEKKMTEQEKKEFSDFIKKIRETFYLNEKNLNGKIDNYLLKFLRFAHARGINLDGRRINMAKRNIIAYISTWSIKNNKKELKFEELKEPIFHAIKYTLPFEAIDIEISNRKIEYIHNLIFDFPDYNDTGVYTIRKVEDVYKLNNEIINKNYPFIKSTITKIISNLWSKENFEEKTLYLEICRAFVKRIHNGELKLQPHDTERLFDCYNRFFDMSVKNHYLYSGLFYFSDFVKDGIIEEKSIDIDVFKIVHNILRDRENKKVDSEKIKEYIKIFKNYYFKEEKNEN
ncbi:MAG: MoxR family ATPase [Candidatus Goldbacteria bacterium]|nr:MoxR family ATPase [Candidatus Goldiibacteriota bacterium]